jgi:hypothetical protein
MNVPPRFPYIRNSEKRDGGWEFRLGRVGWEEVRAKVTVLRGLVEEWVTLLRMGGSGLFGGRPRRGGCAGDIHVTVLRPKNVNVVVVLYFIILAANVCPPISRMMTCVCVSVYTIRFPKYISTYSYSARYSK